jgi:tRNA(Arg) A34 adenosine deaminase TadA
MDFIIRASLENVKRRTGGPFAAGVFEVASGKLISLGVNLVETQNLSILHAEIVAITIAQRILGSYDLGGVDMPQHLLVSSTEPCAMCFGAIPWSGLTRVVTAATDQDARSIGFDEGPKPPNWIDALTSRGITVKNLVLRHEATNVLDEYKASGGHIYNSRES